MFLEAFGVLVQNAHKAAKQIVSLIDSAEDEKVQPAGYKNASPIPYRGQIGLFEVDESEVQNLRTY